MDLIEDCIEVPRITRWSRTLLLGGVEGGSLGLAIGCLLQSKHLSDFVASNRSVNGLRHAVLAAIVMTCFIVPCALLAICAMPQAEGKRLATFENHTKLLAPLCAVGFLPLLLQTSLWKDKQLGFLLATAVFSISVAISGRAAATAAHRVLPGKWLADLGAFRTALKLRFIQRFELPVSLIAVVVVVMIAMARTFAAAKSLNLMSAGELPILQKYAQSGGASFWLSGDALRFNGHLSILGAVCAAWTWLFPKSNDLILLRLLAVTWPALPLYLWTRKAAGSGPAWFMSIAYLSFPLRSMLVPSELFPVAMALGPFVLSAYYLEVKKFGCCLAIAAVAILFNEQVAIWYVALGLYAKSRDAEGWFGGVLALVALGYFVYVATVYLPVHQIMTYVTQPQGLGPVAARRAPQSLIPSVINPAYLATHWFESQTPEFWLIALLPLNFLPVRNSRWFFWLLPALALSCIATLGSDWQTSSITHLLAAGIVSSVATLRELKRRPIGAGGLDFPMYLGWSAAMLPCVALLGALWLPNP